MSVHATIRRWGLPTLLMGVSMAGLWWGWRRAVPDRVHPVASARQSWNAYDDRAKGGDSRCEVFDSRDTLRALVHTGVEPEAYWGIEWAPSGPQTPPRWSWGARDSLVFVWRARHATRQRLFLCSHDPALTSPADPLSRRYLTADLPIGRDWTRSAVSLSDFEPPVWWLALRPGLPNPRKAYLESVVAMQISPASGMAGRTDTLEIASIERVPGRRSPALTWLSLLGLLGGLALGLRPRRGPNPTRQIESTESPSVVAASPSLEPRPLEAPPPDLDRLNRFLVEHYWREDLDLATVASELGLPVRRVTALLNGNGGSFKSTLNGLRLHEARRLLLESHLQISEIAYKVGYGNVSHFNRLFRERFDSSPGALRAALQNRPDPSRNLSADDSGKDPTETG